MKTAAAAALGWLALAGCVRQSAQAASSSSRAVLFISSDLRGYLEPCGCSENMRGGIERAALQISEARKAGVPVFYADCGDSLFPQAHLTPAEEPQERLKAQTLARAMTQMGISVRTVGELDDALGAEQRKSLALPEGKNGSARILTASGRKLALVSAQNAAQLVQGAAEAHSAGAELVIGLVHDSFEHVLAYPAPSVAGVDLLVTSHSPGAASGEESRLTRGNVPTAQVQSKGRALLRLEVSFAGQGRFELMKTQADADRDLAALDERIALLKKQIDAPSLRADSKKLYQERLADLIQRRERLAAAPLPASEGKNTLAARFVPLEAAMPGSPETLALVQAYDREVAKLNLAWAREHGEDCPKPGKNEAGYVGNEACRDCHAEAFPVWDASKHAHAYDDLAKAGKNYRLDCVKCHVVGYQQPGGVCRVDKVEARKDVGCESCHGPGSLHSADPTLDNVVRKPEAELCTGCHDLENSPHFDFALYLPEILGPGHGKPAPDGGTSAPPKRKR